MKSSNWSSADLFSELSSAYSISELLSESWLVLIPETTTVVLTVFWRLSSIWVPQIMLASGSNLSATTWTIFSASCNVKSELPDILTNAPVAFEISISNNGLLNA